MKRLTNLLCYPVHIISSLIKPIFPFNKKYLDVVIGLIIAFSGVVFAHTEFKGVPIFIIDFLGYTLHAIGLIPALRALEEIEAERVAKKEHFVSSENEIRLSETDVERITSEQGMYLQPGDVALVRSANVSEYGDHYIIVTGHPVKKEHGIRPQTAMMPSKNYGWLLDKFVPQYGLTLLKLKGQAKRAFHLFHGITVENGVVKIPTT